MPPSSSGGAPAASDLESCLAAVEQRLAALDAALREGDVHAVEQHAAELHRALAVAVQRFAHAARSGGVPNGLRRRLAQASGQVATHRESLARATAALDRAIEVLLPQAGPGGTYSAGGGVERPRNGGVAQA